jgi:ubiquinone/menaquinone biosynthesis C-methylase UbiE
MTYLGLGGTVVRWIVLRAQKSKQKGEGGFSPEGFVQRGNVNPFPQADFERSVFDYFFGYFPDYPLREALKDKEVLDFGCGYGGKVVEYKRQCGARRVCGVEPHAHVIELARKYAEAQGITEGVEYKVCGHRDIPYPDASFDVVLSYDVLEHVENPRNSVAEIWRVLRPGGMSFNVFPLYFGATAHHLDYIIRTPGLHWVFSPRALVKGVNSVLAENAQFGTAQQPEPRLSFDGAREVLPHLNGLSGVHLESLFKKFEVISTKRGTLWGGRYAKIPDDTRYPIYVRDAFTAYFACVLRKPEDSAASRGANGG